MSETSSAPSPDPSTPDLEQLKAAQVELTKQLEEAKASIAESARTAKQKDEELKRVNEAYQRDVQTLAAYAQQVSQQRNQPSEPEDDDAFVSKKDLRNLTEQLGSAFQQHLKTTISPLEEARLRDQREVNRREAARTLPKFDKYRDEIEAMLNAQPLDVASRPGAYEAAHRLVMSQHLDEVIEEKLAERMATKATADEDADTDDFTPAPARSEPPVATSGATGVRAAVKRPRVQPLTSDEKHAAEVLGVFKDAAEFREWQNPDVEVDVFGFKGRPRV